MGKFTAWAKNHKGTITAIATGAACVMGILVWGLLPEKEQPIVKDEWIPPAKKNWYFESDD